MNAKKKTAWERSKFGKITWVNFFNALAHGVGTFGTTFFALLNLPQLLTDFKLTMWQAFVSASLAGTGAFVFDIIKRLGFPTNSKAFLA